MRFIRSHEALLGVLHVTCCAFVAWTFATYTLAVVHAQQLDPTAFEQAYTTADPINPDRLGLATPAGRYAIRLVSGCDDIGVGQNVLVWPGLDLPPWLPLAPADWDTSTPPPCVVRIEGRMDMTPCLTNDAGLCDISQEEAP